MIKGQVDPLRVAAQKRYGLQCPCCRRLMRFDREPSHRVKPNKATRGHNKAVAHGGNPSVWLYICHRCNQNQQALDFHTWALVLRHLKDDRELNVLELAVFVERWCQENGVEP